MRKPFRVAIALAVVALVGIMLAVPFYTPVASASGDTRQGAGIFTVGGQDQMKTRNWLPAIANDVWTSDVLGRVYDTVGQTHPVTDALVPYIIKGVDDNGDGTFQRSEKGDFLKAPCPAPCADPVEWRRNITAYYDFNGVVYHDGTPATIGDVMFNYILQSLNARYNTDLRVLWDDPNSAAFPANRHLNIQYLGCAAAIDWEGSSALPGDQNKRCGLRFYLQDDFAFFYRYTLAGLTLFPRHLFEQTGGGSHPVTATCPDPDWGNAIYPDTWSVASLRLQGVPTDETAISPFNYPCAEAWQMTDADVIGTGPFKFGTWAFGQFTRVDKNPNFFWGVDNSKQPGDPGYILDPDLPKYMHQPYIDAILYKIYRTTQLGVLALRSGEIDYYHWSVPPEFVPELLNDPNVRVWSNAEPGFFYLSYNMRRQPFGYTTYPPGDSRVDDTGIQLRKAIAHLIDKPTIVRTLLQNYGVIADGVVAPSTTFWYNATLPKYPYNPAQAALILDQQGWTDPSGPCQTDGTGCRSLPVIGTRLIEIMTPQADYDPIRASAGAMIAAAARSVGLNINSKATAFGAIVQAIDARDFDMFILGWRIGNPDPDYMFSFFHSSNAAAGQNYPGFYDTLFDTVMSASRKELDEAVRQQEIKWAQGILSDRLPYDVLYYRTVIDAQREDRFVNFSVSAGTIWNYWSLIGIKQPTTKFIRAVVSVPSAIVEGGSTAVTVTVRDQAGVAVQGATVTLTVTAGSGTFTGGPCTGTNACTGPTGSGGTLTVTYNAPATVPGNPNVEIKVTARSTDPEVPVDSRQKVVTIFATGVQFLSITSILTTGDLVPEGESLVFGLDVRDQDGNLANTASVGLTLDNPAAQVTPATGSASSMRSNIVFRAPSAITTSPATFTVTATATLTGYQDASTDIDFTVVKITNTVTCPDGSVVPAGTPCPTRPIPSLGVLPILAVIGIAAVVYSVMRHRKKGA